MSRDVIISVENVGKKFCRSLKKTLDYGIRDVTRDIFGLTAAASELRRDEFWALKDVSFEVKSGECLGLIGANGAGKSTLLKLLNGIVLPDRGMIRANGRIGALLELGAGFHPMLSGRENILLSGAILGLTKDEVGKKYDAIVDFSELKDSIDSPVKYYSSGMYVRLGFAVAVHADPNILLIDEALAVGDFLFQSKCFAKLREFKDRGTTVIFVTHNLDLVTSHCCRAVLLDKGVLVGEGTPKSVIDRYNRLAFSNGRNRLTNQAEPSCQVTRSQDTEWHGLFQINPNEDRYGSKQAEIVEIGIFDMKDLPIQVLRRSQKYLIKVKVRHHENMLAPIVACTIKDAKGTVLCGTNTLFQNIQMDQMEQGEVIVVTFKQAMRLNPGEYLLSVGVGSLENGQFVVFDRRFDYLPFRVVSDSPRTGLFDIESDIEWNRCS